MRINACHCRILPFLLLALAVPAMAQNQPIDQSANGINLTEGRSWPATLLGQGNIPVTAINGANSPRVYQMIRGGKMYLSLDDAIALALENNLDIAIQRQNLPIADTDILRARGGSVPRGVSTGLVTGTPGGSTATATTGAAGTTGATGAGAGGTSAGAGGAGSGVGGLVTSTVGAGPVIPMLDPVFNTTASYGHDVIPQASLFGGPAAVLATNKTYNFSYNQGFLPGTAVSIGFNNSSQATNNFFQFLSPEITSSLSITVTQPLLQGFGSAINGREIVIAKNNREISDIAFRQQVEYTVSQVETIYWGLVSASEAVNYAQQAVNVDNTILNNNRRQVEIGTMAPISITQAQAQLATDQQNLITAQTNFQAQGLLLKNAVTKNMNDEQVADAQVVPTSTILIPEIEPIRPVQDLIRDALQYRPELAIARINMTNDRLSIRSAKSELEPTLNAFGTYGANAIAGSINPNLNTALLKTFHSSLPTEYVGGPGLILRSLFGHDFANNSIGLNLQIPIRNRNAQADVIRSQLELRQAQLSEQQQENQIIIQVRQQQFTIQQDHAAVEAAQQAVTLSQQTLEADQKKLALGAATVTDVITDQKNLTQSESNLLTARANYQNAKVELDRLTGRTLQNLRISIIDAENGRVTQMPHATTQ